MDLILEPLVILVSWYRLWLWGSLLMFPLECTFMSLRPRQQSCLALFSLCAKSTILPWFQEWVPLISCLRCSFHSLPLLPDSQPRRPTAFPGLYALSPFPLWVHWGVYFINFLHLCYKLELREQGDTPAQTYNTILIRNLINLLYKVYLQLLKYSLVFQATENNFQYFGILS